MRGKILGIAHTFFMFSGSSNKREALDKLICLQTVKVRSNKALRVYIYQYL